MPAVVIDPRSGAARGARALVLAVVAVGLAGAAHTAATGCLDATGLALALGLAWPGAVVVARRRQHPAYLIAWVAAAQLATHVVMDVTCGGVHGTSAGVLVGHGAAGLLTTAVLARADDRLWVAHAVRRAVSRLALPRPLPVPVLVRPRVRPLRVPLPRSPHLVSSPVLRGPPSGPVLLP